MPAFDERFIYQQTTARTIGEAVLAAQRKAGNDAAKLYILAEILKENSAHVLKQPTDQAVKDKNFVDKILKTGREVQGKNSRRLKR